MSSDSGKELKGKIKEKGNNKEYKWKELLYELFYEIKSEILGKKIEISEDEYQENIKSSTIPLLVKYIHDSIQILIEKKVESISELKLEETNHFSSNNELYLKKMEAKERYLIKLCFQNKLQKDAIENKLNDYMEMEEKFEELKTKLKYEDGRFLNNDRKDNEIIIIRGENSNLKKTINNLEKQIQELNKKILEKSKLISELENRNKNLNVKMDKIQKQNEILNSNNININNLTGNNTKNNILLNNINNIENLNQHIQGKFTNYFNCDLNKYDENNNKYFPYKKVKNKILNEKKNQRDSLSNTKNELSEKTKSDFLNKYFAVNKINYNKINLPLNNSYAKINYYPIGENNNKSNINKNIPLINRNSNLNFIKQVIFSGENTNNKRASTNKIN